MASIASPSANVSGGSQRKQRLPILIFPGFLSSALEVKQSPVYSTTTSSSSADPNSSSSSSQARRIWLNIASAGFSKLYFGGALKSNEERYEQGQEYNEALHQEYAEESQCKSKWIQHLRLSEQDLVSDPPGIQVRATQGVQAVDYLAEHGLAKHVSWVFSNVVQTLKKEGYTEGHDLDAASYDWRVPPSHLEARDQYFTNTVAKIEQMYQQNNNTPVVLLCHSMGCKVCHYFLSFAHRHKGKAWLDQHVHTYFVVGAPHLGAPKSVRGTMVGDRMGLEAFLNEEEALILARTWGSVPWMWPGMLPEGTGPIAYLRREGVLHVTVLPFDCGPQVSGSHRTKKPSRLKLAVTYGDQTIYSRFHSAASEDEMGENEFPVSFSETFTFPSTLDLDMAKKKSLRISLYEPGLEIAKTCCKSWVCTCVGNLVRSTVDLLFPMQFWRRIGCLKNRPIVSGATEGAVLAAERFATMALGSATLLADSEMKDLSNVELSAGPFKPVECSLQLRFGGLRKPFKDFQEGRAKRDIVVGDTSSIPVKVRLEWFPPQHDVDTELIAEKGSIRIGDYSADAPILDIHHRRGNKDVQYEPVNGVQLFRSEFIIRHRTLMHNYYENDELGPRTLSAKEAPPVKNVKAVYGIDLPTEVAAVYRRRTLVQEKNKRKCVHELDPDARLDRRHTSFQIKHGSIMETDHTPQIVHGQTGTVQRSGDGTVPYFSLQQCRQWQSETCQVQVHELPHAEHRDILGDERFLEILVDYVTNQRDD